MGVDFGRLLETQAKTDEHPPSSAPPSRSNSRTASITSLSSFMTTDTIRDDPDEVISRTIVMDLSKYYRFLQFKSHIHVYKRRA